MKIIVQQPQEPILEGIVPVLSNIGEEVFIWYSTSPLTDLIDIHNPDIIFCYTQNMKQYCTNNAKLVCIGPRAPNKGIEPNLICTFDDTNTTLPHSHYKDRCLFIEPAANFIPHNITHDEKYASDIFYYSPGHLSDVMPYLQYVDKHYQLKIAGSHKILLSSYLGNCSRAEMVQFSKSCKIALTFDLSTLYTHAANKIFCLTDQECGLYPYFDTITELKEHLDIYLFDPQKTQDLANIAYNKTIAEHTYFHRVADIFTKLGYIDKAKKCLQHLQQIL